MASTWTVEASWDGFTFTAPPGGTGPTYRFDWTAGLEAICLPLLDPLPQFNTASDNGDFYFRIGITKSGFAQQGIQVRLSDAEFKPQYWSAPFFVFPAPTITGSTAALTAGGTLSITKDYDNDLITFVGPLGTQTMTLSDADPFTSPSYRNTTPLRPRGFAAEFSLPDPTASFPAIAVDHKIDWYNLVGKENGVTYQTVPLSTGSPGTWWPIFYIAFDPLVGPTNGISFPWTWTQLTTREEIEAQATTVSGPFFDEYSFGYRIFDTWRRLRSSMVDTAIDLELAAEHGVMWRAGAHLAAPSQMDVQRSFDNARNWEAIITAFSDVSTTNSSPSITWANEVLYLCWYNGTNMVEARSRDLGVTWQVPTTIPFTGTNPRRLQSRHGGPAYYFFINGSGDLEVVRSADNSATFDGPYTITTGIGMQQVDAEFDNDGAIVVAYIDTTPTWTQKRSRDHGVTWS